MTKLTLKKLRAMQSALNAALAGGGFDGGDFEGENQDHFEAALEWVEAMIAKRTRGRKRHEEQRTVEGDT